MPSTVVHASLADLSPAEQRAFQAALDQARLGLEESGVPVGSSLLRGNEIVAAGRNRRVQEGDPIAHGEMNCLRLAGRQPTYGDTVLVTTLSPCDMCTGAISLFKIPRVIVGEAENFVGGHERLAANGVEVVLVDDDDCKSLMREFMDRFPDVWAEDIAESDARD